MKGRLKAEFLTGLVFIAAVCILGYFTIMVSHEVFKGNDTYLMSAVFNDAAGLQKSNKVMVNGVYSGSVVSVDLCDQGVIVEMEMFKKFSLYSNYKIMIGNDSVLGGRQIKICPGTGMDPSGKTFETVSVDTILAGEKQDIFETLNSVVEENRENIRITIANIRKFSDKLNSGKGTVSRLLTDDKIADKTENLLDQVKDTIEDVREQAPVTSFIRAALMAF